MHLYDHDAFGADAPSAIAGTPPAGVSPASVTLALYVSGPNDPRAGGYTLNGVSSDGSVKLDPVTLPGFPTNDAIGAAFVSAAADQGIVLPATLLNPSPLGHAGQPWGAAGDAPSNLQVNVPMPARTLIGTVKGDVRRHRYLFLGAGVAVLATVIVVLVIHSRNKKARK